MLENEELDTGLEEEIPESGEEEVNNDFEDDALKQGWVPKEKYKGDPKRWVDAETFVKRGEIFRPMLSAKNKELEEKLEESNRKYSEQQKAIERTAKMQEKLFERARQDALAEIRREQKEAWAQGDDAKYDQLEKRRDKLDEEFKVEEPKAAPATAQQIDPYVKKFQDENPWFGRDYTLTQAAQFHDARLHRENPTLTPEQRHAEVKKALVEEFPSKFENPNRRGKTAVGTGRSPGKSSQKQGWDSIPEADKKMATGFIRSSGGKLTKETYAKDYWAMIKEEENE